MYRRGVLVCDTIFVSYNSTVEACNRPVASQSNVSEAQNTISLMCGGVAMQRNSPVSVYRRGVSACSTASENYNSTVEVCSRPVASQNNISEVQNTVFLMGRGIFFREGNGVAKGSARPI